jgi:cytochrome c oxidase assembly protein subunit 15
VRALRILVPAAAAIALVLAGLGAWVRINNAAIACTGWPLCPGLGLADLHGGAALEIAHRAAAGLEGIFLAAIVYCALPLRGRVAGIVSVTAATVAIFLAEAALGAASVFTRNSPLAVTAHWALAVSLLAALAALWIVLACDARRANAGRLWQRLGATSLLAFLAMCLGSFIASTSIGAACPEFPACTSAAALSAAQWIHVAHRFVAGSFIVVATLSATATLQRGPAGAKRAVLAGLALALLQAGLGIATVRFGLPPGLRELHAAAAALTFIVFTAATALAAVAPQTRRSPLRSAVAATA